MPLPVQFFFGALSPYSWFAAERIGDLLPDARWRPVFAGGLFRSVGRVSWGLTGERAAKVADCDRRAAELGLGPIRWQDAWPTSDVHVARAMVAAERAGRLQPFALEAMRLCFREGADLAEPAAIAEAARRAGLEAEGIVAATGAPEVKQALRATNDEAVALGVIGVPTVAVGDRLYWGEDRLDEAVAAAG